MKTYNTQVKTAVPLNADFESQPFQLMNILGYSVQAKVTGTPNGTFQLQASSDSLYETPVNWNVIAGSELPITESGLQMWNVIEAMYNHVKVVYIDSSGGTSTAVADISINAKGF